MKPSTRQLLMRAKTRRIRLHRREKLTAALKSLRTHIDKLDLQILKLVNERASLAREIGKIKNDHGTEVFSPAREEEVLKNVLDANKGPLDEDHGPGRLPRDHERLAGTAEGPQGRISWPGIQLQPSGRRRTLRPSRRIHARRQHRLGLRGGQPQPRRFRRRAAGELDRRRRLRHARHVHAVAAIEDLRGGSAAGSTTICWPTASRR